MKHFHDTDIISRIFRKPRGERTVEYEFKTRADIYWIPPEENNNNFKRLTDYLRDCFEDGVIYRDKGCSDCDEIFGLEFEQREDTTVMKICQKSGFMGKGTQMHPIVQDYFLHNDMYTVAMEVPVSSESHDRSGFIDLVRYQPDEDVIWILDFKPNAHKERWQKVMSQLFWYRKLLSENAGIPEDKIKCAYFDNLNYYQLK